MKRMTAIRSCVTAIIVAKNQAADEGSAAILIVISILRNTLLVCV